MSTPIYRDKTTLMTDPFMADLKRLGWGFYMTGPSEWEWIRFDMAGKAVARQGDQLWDRDITMIEEIARRKLLLRDRDGD